MYTYLTGLMLCMTMQMHAQTFEKRTLAYGNLERSYWIYVPSMYDPLQPANLLINLHGFGKDGAYAARHRNFRPLADTANCIVVYPNGSREKLTGSRFWNYGKVMGSDVDDVAFLEAMIDTIAAQYAINQKRIYAVGMSNGSYLCYLLACRSKRFAAIASVTGSMSVKMFNECMPDTPIPVLHIHGTKDPINPYKGNKTSKGIEDVIEFWAKANGCAPEPVTEMWEDVNGKDGVTAQHILYTGGVHGHQVALIKIIGGGHSWPGAEKKTMWGKTSRDLDATQEVWRFVRQFERNE
ncbi:MAG: prolyl oligopeptidase family serine peptidase [Ferruginibacter sp.]|nr:prolyl oligopeptidase family serine peptidase [Ferruginibacter sp.]